MFTSFSKLPLAALLLSLVCSLSTIGQSDGSPAYKSQNVADDGTPVLIKHLPQWESVRDQTTLAATASELKVVLGERSILDQIEFPGGAEAATAQYDAGKLLIVEYSTPQASIDADSKITANLDRDGTVYRRIGNYNAFVFDPADQLAANGLLDQIKYEKSIQWLGANPYIVSPERAFVLQTADLFVSTVLIIVMGIGFAILLGIVSGYAFFAIREHKRASTPTFSDAGGLTRLNLDGFTPEIVPETSVKRLSRQDV